MREGKIRVNGAKVKQNYRIEVADELTLPDLEVEEQHSNQPPVPKSFAQRIARSIVFEDEDLIAVNKPAGVAVHRGTGVRAGVIEALRQVRPEYPELELVHRLDRETSGVLLVAKTSTMLRYLQRVLRERPKDIGRFYLAVVEGAWPHAKRRSVARLANTGNRTIVCERTGQPAETRFDVVRRMGSAATMLRVQLITGRKHQIRVHCQEAGHPILGDSRYGGPRHELMLLHAHRVEVPMPNGSLLTIEAPTPPQFRAWEVSDQHPQTLK